MTTPQLTATRTDGKAIARKLRKTYGVPLTDAATIGSAIARWKNEKIPFNPKEKEAIARNRTAMIASGYSGFLGR